MNSGVKQWIFQRITNAVIVSFGIALACVLFSGKDLSHESLTQLIASSNFTYYFAVVLVLACFNSILAGWQIDGDYAKKFGIPQKLITVCAVLGSLVYLAYGLKLLFT